MKLTAENVNAVLMDCLFTDGEDTSDHVIGNGVRLKVGFHPARLSANTTDIESMADQLPSEFKKSSGGGSSFLNACLDNEGYQWGEHNNIDELVALGTAVNKIVFPFPSEMWKVLPGGMPYICVL